MNSEFERARKEWDDEVGSEAARLVREGTPPFDAAERALHIVSDRRCTAARARYITELRLSDQP